MKVISRKIRRLSNSKINFLKGKKRKKTDMATEKEFIGGVVEGFYGRPWTFEQRKELFARMKALGLNTYLYAPKDDIKHRAMWRDLYNEEEQENLKQLIKAAKEHGITFYYAISPGLDMVFSNPKEVYSLKKKFEQVQNFGCEAFSLLFDDIDPEMRPPDNEVFKSFAEAQVKVSNEIFSFLGQPKFLFCPTEYCSTRAVPSVENSSYLNTLGQSLDLAIDILWTGKYSLLVSIFIFLLSAFALFFSLFPAFCLI